MYIVYVRIPTGNTIDIYIPEPYTVEIAKQEISRKQGIHPHDQQLIFNAKVLEGGHTFDEYSVQYGSTLDLVVRQGSKYMY